MSTTTRRRTHRVVAVAIALSLMTACGSSLSDDEILAGSGQRVAAAGLGTADATGTEAPADGSSTTVVGEAPPAESGGVPAQGAPTAAQGGEVADPASGGAEGGAPTPAAAGGCKDSASEPVVIGNFGDYTGPAGASTADIPNGLKIWAASVNDKGGLCGRQVRIVTADAGGDPARGAAIAREQVERDGAVAFVSNSGLSSGPGAYPYLISNKIPVIGDSLADDASKKSATIMSVYPTVQEGAPGGMRAALQISKKDKFGMMYCVENQICSEIHESFKSNAAKVGAKWVWDARPSLLQVDFTAECQGARQAGVEVLAIMMDAASVLRIARSCNRQGFRPTYVLIGNAITAGTINEPGLEESVVLSLSFPFAGASSPAIDEYHHARKTYYADRPSTGGLGSAWAAAKVFEVIAKRAVEASGTLTSESIVAAMQTLKDETAGGLVPGVTWGAQGSTSKPCMFALRGDGSGGYTTPLGAAPIC